MISLMSFVKIGLEILVSLPLCGLLVLLIVKCIEWSARRTTTVPLPVATPGGANATQATTTPPAPATTATGLTIKDVIVLVTLILVAGWVVRGCFGSCQLETPPTPIVRYGDSVTAPVGPDKWSAKIVTPTFSHSYIDCEKGRQVKGRSGDKEFLVLGGEDGPNLGPMPKDWFEFQAVGNTPVLVTITWR